MLIGAHMSIGKGISRALEDALRIGSTTMQIFSRNPRGGKAKKLDYPDIQKSKEITRAKSFGPWVAHAPYTINLASLKPEIREFGVHTILEDFLRMKEMGAGFIVVHAGSHGGQGTKKGEELLIQGLNELLPQCPPGMLLLLEVMAGQGTELGNTLEQMQKIIGQVECQEKIGICLDSCHLFAAGYDVREWDDFWQKLSGIINVEKIKVLHLNDCKFPLGAQKDRHAAIGEGEIGREGIKNIILHPSTREIPLILETPNDLAGWAKEIEMIKDWRLQAGIL
ncbi:MAG: deoxyribonuclease IV [Peptococcaceae bacterium]